MRDKDAQNLSLFRLAIRPPRTILLLFLSQSAFTKRADGLLTLSDTSLPAKNRADASCNRAAAHTETGFDLTRRERA